MFNLLFRGSRKIGLQSKRICLFTQRVINSRKCTVFVHRGKIDPLASCTPKNKKYEKKNYFNLLDREKQICNQFCIQTVSIIFLFHLILIFRRELGPC